jgi:hypothetical protein
VIPPTRGPMKAALLKTPNCAVGGVGSPGGDVLIYAVVNTSSRDAVDF